MSYHETLDQTNKKILVVEDSPTQALRIQFLLENNGYEVAVASNGVEALEHLEKNDPVLVISDVVMPHMDGYELCRNIKANHKLKDKPILLLTSLSEPEDILKGLESGAENFLTKPYDEKVLLSRIQYILVNRVIRMNPSSNIGIEIFFAGKKHFINSDRIQIMDLLFSTYETAMQQKRELERVNKELKEALDTLRALHGIIPICSHCKKIRDKDNLWHELEMYIESHSEAEFSHGICPECAEAHYPEYEK